jgi:murein DD-endopeptidase MepM/ murein hydrolase activator NlpD
MLASGEVDTDVIAKLGYTETSSPNAARGGPFDSASQADPTFKSLFTSWKARQSPTAPSPSRPTSQSRPPSSPPVTASGPTFRGGAARHAGIDLAAPIGTPIYATADGTVSNAGYNSGGYGNLIKLDHGRGIETRYGHLSAILVSAGQHITRGQLIGRMGSTGRSTGSHLHYEVRIDGRAVNPIPS